MKRNITRRNTIRALGAAGMIGLAGCGGGGDGGGGDGGGGDGGDGGGGDGGGGDGGGGDGGDGGSDGGGGDGGDGGSDGGGGDGGDGGGATDGGGDSGGGGKETVKGAWVYVSEVGDLGWSWAHDQGRKKVSQKYDWLKTDISEAIPPGNSKRVFRQYVSQDFDVIFGTTFGYMDPMFQVAKQSSNTIFEHCSGYKTRENMGRYFGRMYQARYLAGIASGMVTEANKLGYVAAFPTPEVVRGINAYTLGAASVNPQVTTKVRWTNTWFGPSKAQQAAQALIDEGVDVMAQHQDSPAAVRAANDANIWATGYDAPMSQFGGDNYLTSPIWHWEVFYDPAVQAVKNGTWESDSYWKGLKAGIVDLDEWGPKVPENVKSKVSDVRSGIKKGNVDIWSDSKFAGKSDSFLFQKMSSYVEEVEGTVPN